MAKSDSQPSRILQLVKLTVVLAVIAVVLVGWVIFQQRGQRADFWSPVKKTQSEINQTTNLVSENYLAPHQLERTQTNIDEQLSSQRIYGFLPYWNVRAVEQIDPAVTDLIYFRLAFDESGLILGQQETTETEVGVDYWLDPNWLLVSQNFLNTRSTNRLHVTLFSDDKTVLNQVLTDEQRIDTLVLGVHNFLIANPQVTGLNLDFEYFSGATPEVREGLVLFLKKINLLKKQHHPNVEITLAAFGRSGQQTTGLYDWDLVAPEIDQVILMGYDYRTRASSTPGPVAPVLGKEIWGADIFESLQALLKKMPANKIVLAVPFYGYQWEVTNFDLPQAKTFPETGVTLTEKRVQELLADDQELSVETGWDEAALSPYLFYENNGRKYLGFYEDERSLGYKMDLAKELNLTGVAVWAIGYESEQSNLWSVLANKLF